MAAHTYPKLTRVPPPPPRGINPSNDRQVYSRLLVVSKDHDRSAGSIIVRTCTSSSGISEHGWFPEETKQEYLLKELEMDNLAQSTLPDRNRDQSAYIIDLLAVIQTLSKGKMTTFGELSDTIAAIILAKLHFAHHAHVVPDRYGVEDSIKSGERSRQGSKQRNYVTCQAENNKSNLLSILYADWCEKLPLELKDNETWHHKRVSSESHQHAEWRRHHSSMKKQTV